VKRGRIFESATHWADIVAHKSKKDVKAENKETLLACGDIRKQ